MHGHLVLGGCLFFTAMIFCIKGEQTNEQLHDCLPNSSFRNDDCLEDEPFNLPQHAAFSLWAEMLNEFIREKQAVRVQHETGAYTTHQHSADHWQLQLNSAYCSGPAS